MAINGSRRPHPHPLQVVLLTAALAACSSGGGDEESVQPGTDLPANDAAAVHFLQQATFGADDDSIARLSFLGYRSWLDEQFDRQPSLHRPELEARVQAGETLGQSHRQAMWWKRALLAPDQLRQRVAFALSEIFVISDRNDALSGDPVGMAEYQDLLVNGAFGSYRELIEAVTKSPLMGKYLSHLRNRKANVAANTRPDENYAREVMQLFSIGLVMLNPDGSVQLDPQGQPISTYEQEDIAALASVFTGWNYAGATSWSVYTANYRPMEPWEAFHERAPKTVLGTAFPANVDAGPEMEAAMDLLANHPNVGPFLGKQLIQRLVTSNPSPAYVARIAAVWANDGAGARGNLRAIVRAILLDDEAMTGGGVAAFGKLREPLVMQTQLWRAFRARAADDQYTYGNPENAFGQAAMRSASVFNFFRPDSAPQGEIAAAGLVAPEFDLMGHSVVTSTINQFYNSIVNRRVGAANTLPEHILVDLTNEITMAGDVDALLDRLDKLLLAGRMTSAMRGVLRTHLLAETDLTFRALDAIYLVASSPEFFVQK